MSIAITNIKKELETNKDLYLDLTHQLNNYNEIYNVNFYLKNMNTLEADRLIRTNDNMKAKILKMKQEYMLLEYGVNENRLRANIMYTTMIVSAIIFILCAMVVQEPPKLKMEVCVMISLTIIVVYFCIILLILKGNAQRRRYAWDQYYWKEMKKSSL